MALTLNQVKRRLESLANSHRQLRTVRFVGYDEALDESDVTYPLCVIELQTDNMVSLRDRLTYFNFKVYLFDPINIKKEALGNEYEVKSDLASIAQDLIAMVNFNEYLADWSVDEEYNFKIANYQLQDLTGGVQFDLRIGVWYDANRCQVPASEVHFETDISQDMKIISNFVHDVTEEANTLTLSAMYNRDILLFYLGDKLLKKIDDPDAILTPDEYRYTPEDSFFEFGTDLQPEQVIQILNRSL